MPEMPSNQAHRRAASWCPLAALLAVTLLWSYWPTLVELWQFWHRSGDYSVGRLVPLVAAYLIWSDRRNLRGFATRANWWGLGVFAAA